MKIGLYREMQFSYNRLAGLGSAVVCALYHLSFGGVL